MSRVSLLNSLTNSVSLEALIIEVHFTLTPVASTLSKRDVCVLIWVNESLVACNTVALNVCLLSQLSDILDSSIERKKTYLSNVLHECTA